jgi:hypothetical protein
MTNEEKIPEIEEKPDPTTEFVDSLTRLKQERAAKKEKKKVVKQMTNKFGDAKLAKKMVKTAVRNIAIRRTAGRGR